MVCLRSAQLEPWTTLPLTSLWPFLPLLQVAVHAMQAALNATATSALAMHLTKEALHRSANDETDELINVLNQAGGSSCPVKGEAHRDSH